jgi:hypothetical protein
MGCSAERTHEAAANLSRGHSRLEGGSPKAACGLNHPLTGRAQRHKDLQHNFWTSRMMTKPVAQRLITPTSEFGGLLFYVACWIAQSHFGTGFASSQCSLNSFKSHIAGTDVLPTPRPAVVLSFALFSSFLAYAYITSKAHSADASRDF